MKSDQRSGGMQRPAGEEGETRGAAPKSDADRSGARSNDRRDQAGQKDNARGASERAGGERGNARSANISSEQRTKITTTLRGGPAKRLDHVDFAIRIGASVPRSYQYYPLPAEIIEIVPEYRGYDYILVGDQILIIDPDSGEIVYVI